MGGHDGTGIMQLTLDDIFQKMDKAKLTKSFKAKACYLEIYNENIKDLLSTEDRNLDLREDPTKGNTIAGITEIEVKTTQEIMHILKVGNKNRSKEATGANEVSSRSHAIL